LIKEVKGLQKEHPAGPVDMILDLIVRYHPPVFRYCYHMLRHKQEAEDAVQDIFLKVVQHSARLEEIRSPSAWIYRVAHHHCLNLAAKKRLQRLLPVRLLGISPTVAEDSHSQAEEAMAIAAMLARLNPAERSIMILRILEDKSHEEIAVITGASPAAVRKKFERAKNKLRQACGPKEEDIHEQEGISFI
jgi:RNA polymerase sigma-70 factor, ECF subfamily